MRYHSSNCPRFIKSNLKDSKREEKVNEVKKITYNSIHINAELQITLSALKNWINALRAYQWDRKVCEGLKKHIEIKGF